MHRARHCIGRIALRVVSDRPDSVIEVDKNASEWDGSSLENLNSQQGIKIPGYGTIYFPADETDVSITLYNPEDNECYFQFELYIDGESEPVASTGAVEPGSAVTEVTLSRPLEAGTYQLDIKINTYTLDGLTPLNDAVVSTDLTVTQSE